MKIRDSQFELLAAANMDRARRDSILNLRSRGFAITENSANKTYTVLDAEGCSTRVESRGLRCRIISPEGRVTEMEQHPSGRIRRIMDPSNREVVFNRDADGYLQSIDRGPSGGTYRFELSRDWKPLRIDYPDGTSSLAEYSPDGQPIRIVNRNGTEISYEYAQDGRLTALVDPQGNRTQLLHKNDSSLQIEYPNGDQHVYVASIGAHLLRFDVNGETHAHYRYNGRNHSVESRYRDGSRERFVFDKGLLVEAANEHSVVRFQYDHAGRLTLEETNGQTVRYLRNTVGALIGIVTPEGDTISYNRDRDQRLTEITDWRGDRFGISLPASGPPVEIRYPNGLATTTKANPMGLPSSWWIGSPGSLRQIDAISWEYDLCDRLVSAARHGQRREYCYDKASRLVEVRCLDKRFAEHFDLDIRGNRVQSGRRQANYDAVNRLLRLGNREFLYDGLGNQTVDREGERASLYTFNGRGHLVSIRTGELTIEYAYDALGRRIRKRVGGITTDFHWAGTQVLSETTGDGTHLVRRDYLVCPEFLNALAFREDSAVYYMHLGRLQEPLCVTDRTGSVVWKAEYLAFGQAFISVDKIRQPWRLPGQYHDTETGLHYAVARYYDPDLGRFLAMDPQCKPGTSLNYYTYCDGDPVNRIDPTGEISLALSTVLIAVGVGAAVGALAGGGVEVYKQRNQEHKDWSQVGYAALVGGCLGGIGAAVGAVAGAATLGVLGVLGSGAAAGGLGSAVTYCVQAAGQGQWNWVDFGTTVAIGAGIGAVTAGVGGMVASRFGKAGEDAADDVAGEAGDLAQKPLDKLLEGAVLTKSGKTVQYQKTGGFDQANSDFDVVTADSTVKYQGNGIRSAELTSGGSISVRPQSTGGSPTVQLNQPGQKPVKIRY